MKPYGRDKTVKGHPAKIDYHVHENNRKIGSWWEDCSGSFNKKSARQKAKKEIACT